MSYEIAQEFCDVYEDGLIEGRKQGALEELRNVQDISFIDGLTKEQTLNKILIYIGKKVKELEGVEK